MGHLLSEPMLQRCLDLITVNGARKLGLDAQDYGVHVGAEANLVLLDARDDKDALWHHADVLASVRRGRLVFRRPRREFTEAMEGFLPERPAARLAA